MRWEVMGPFVLLILTLFALPSCYSLPICTDSTAPLTLNASLTFCGYNGSSCCNATYDVAIQKQFNAMNISDKPCANIIKSILCTKCNPYAGELYTIEPKTVPALCNTTQLPSPTPANSTAAFCTQVWDTCKDIPIPNSPFQGGTGPATKLSDLYSSTADFCSKAGASATDQTVCFNGVSAAFNATQPAPPPKGICLEKLDNGSYINLVPHPDGSNRVFLSTLKGKIFLATVPEQGSGKTLEIDEASPFLDLTDLVHYDNEFGMLGLAIHPDFTNNGRLFVSYSCDKTQSATCSGKCSCNSEINCDPSKLGTDSSKAQPCQYQSVIAEYTVNSTGSTPSKATNAQPTEVRRIFTMGLPYTTHHGGQILFGPSDGFLYFMMGDGGSVGDPWNFAQNKKSVLGKILRIDVNNMPSPNDITNLSLWGNYTIPNDNPYNLDASFGPEVWAFGLKNPWRCSFDLERPSYFFCGDVGEVYYEEIDLIRKAGNYGWRVYEGFTIYNDSLTPSNSINPIFPVMGYTHSEVNNNVGSASVTGGYVYRGSTDPCLYGRYIYADLYAIDMWASAETPQGSGNFSNDRITFNCSKTSPISCDYATTSPLPSLGYIDSFGEDNNKDIYFLTFQGIYRIVRPSLCNFSCPLEKPMPPPPPPSSSAFKLEGNSFVFVLACLLFFLGLNL